VAGASRRCQNAPLLGLPAHRSLRSWQTAGDETVPPSWRPAAGCFHPHALERQASLACPDPTQTRAKMMTTPVALRKTRATPDSRRVAASPAPSRRAEGFPAQCRWCRLQQPEAMQAHHWTGSTVRTPVAEIAARWLQRQGRLLEQAATLSRDEPLKTANRLRNSITTRQMCTPSG
jgi:hypothetical protein